MVIWNVVLTLLSFVSSSLKHVFIVLVVGVVPSYPNRCGCITMVIAVLHSAERKCTQCESVQPWKEDSSKVSSLRWINTSVSLASTSASGVMFYVR
jgi:hypothetical protein